MTIFWLPSRPIQNEVLPVDDMVQQRSLCEAKMVGAPSIIQEIVPKYVDHRRVAGHDGVREVQHELLRVNHRVAQKTTHGNEITIISKHVLEPLNHGCSPGRNVLGLHEAIQTMHSVLLLNLLSDPGHVKKHEVDVRVVRQLKLDLGADIELQDDVPQSVLELHLQKVR